MGDRILVFGGMQAKYMQSKDLYTISLEDFRTTFEVHDSIDMALENHKSVSKRPTNDFDSMPAVLSEGSRDQLKCSEPPTSSEEGASCGSEDPKLRIITRPKKPKEKEPPSVTKGARQGQLGKSFNEMKQGLDYQFNRNIERNRM